MSASFEWGQVLRGLVYEAFALRGAGDEYTAALHAIVDAYYGWPLAQALMYLDDARQLLADDHHERERAELAWYADVFAALDRRRETEAMAA